jgi:hypothetical protein
MANPECLQSVKRLAHSLREQESRVDLRSLPSLTLRSGDYTAGREPPRAGTRRNLRVRKPLMGERVLWWSALKSPSGRPIRFRRMSNGRELPSFNATIAPASGHRGVTGQQPCATDRPETASPLQHRPATALGRAVGRAWFGSVDRDSYAGRVAQCAGSACDHHAGRTRVGL